MRDPDQMSMPSPDPSRYDGSKPEPPYRTPHADHRLRTTPDQKAHEAALDNLRDAHFAMLLIRETVETLGPVGCMRSGEHVCCAVAPTFDAEAQEIVRGIQAIHSARSVA